MVDNTTAVATVNMAMLDRAEADSNVSSVMSSIHKLKIYNPKPGQDADPEKANKYILIEANTGNEIFLEGEIKFNPITVSYQYNGDIYPTLEDGSISEDEVSFSTSEFGRFDKRTDTIGLSAKGKKYAFFTKGEFETMIKTPMLRVLEDSKDPNSKYIDMINQFYEKKKDVNNVPYHGSLLRKIGIIYGRFVGGQYDGEFFRMYTSPNNIGVTYDAENQTSIDPNEGTLEYVTIPGLAEMNTIRTQNNKKAISRLALDQCDVILSIKTNDKGNFRPLFSYAGLVAMRGYDNTDEINYIKDLRHEHFTSIYGTMGNPVAIAIEGTKATVSLPKLLAEHTDSHQAIEAPKDTKEVATSKDAEAVFDELDDNF